MKLGTFEILCGNCKVKQKVDVLSIETSEESVKIAYKCLECKKTMFEEFIPKERL